MEAPPTVAVIGHGLIGGSVALAATVRVPGARVLTLDRGDDLTVAAGADFVFLSAPVLQNISVLQALRPLVGPGTLITDTGSTKAAIVEAGQDMRFIGGHPVAGAADRGREHARADLFDGRTWLLTPTAGTNPDDRRRLTTFLTALGAQVRAMDAADHDRLFAAISHLPQLVASALMAVVSDAAGPAGLQMAGAGLRDSTRIASSPPDIWRDVLATNRDEIAPLLDACIAVLARLRDDESGQALVELFERAREGRRSML